MAMTVLLSLFISWTSLAHAAPAFEPCRIWIFDFESSAYVCRLKGALLATYSAQDVDKLIAKLDARIHELEARVKALEGREDR